MNKIIKKKDKLSTNGIISLDYKPNVLQKTKIIGGFNPRINEKGITELGEVLFEEENQIVLGGALFILEKIFGVTSPLLVDYLNNIMGIATTGATVTEIYPKDTLVCLFGVGIGGAGDTITSVLDVKFYEREIFDMVPFRVIDGALSAEDVEKYWFKKLLLDDKQAYYLKKFEAPPAIKVLWKDAEGDEDGTVVEAGVHDTTRIEPIESFIELILKISKTDVREWFELQGNIEQARINSIGLFTGIKSQLADGTFDYKQVKLFSKLNIGNELLQLAKDLTIIYRIYTS